MPDATPQPGVVRFSAYELVPMSVLRDVSVLPSLSTRRTLNDGGPVLPDWDNQVELRHGRYGFPMPLDPQEGAGRFPYMDESFVWGGFVERHFGHQICEYATRLLPAITERPDDRVLFAMWPEARPSDVPDVFWALIDWFGLPRHRVKLVHEPFVARELRMAPQPEQLHGLGPSYRFLELLGRNEAARGLTPVRDDVVYVSRAAMIRKNLASWVGEGYLTDCLRRLGVTVFEPQEHALAHQLAVYAGAKKLIFAEGSAVHGRQALGFHEQEIMVLARRPHARIAMSNLAPRCRRLSYGEVTEGLIRMVFHDGKFDMPRALSVYHTENLFRAFAAMGVDLRGVWDEEAFAAYCRMEVLDWLKNQFNQVRQKNRNFDWDKTIAQVRLDLRRHGFDSIYPEANFWLQRKIMREEVADDA